MSEISRLFPLDGQALEPLWREVLGSRLRALRTERGRKEPSSEMIAALAGALDVTVADLMAGTAEDLRRAATIVVSGAVVRPAATVPRPSGQRPAGPVAL